VRDAFQFVHCVPPRTTPQESGRGGRDGREAVCTLYYTYADAAKSRHMIKQSAQENNAPEEQTKSNMESLNAMVGAAWAGQAGLATTWRWHAVVGGWATLGGVQIGCIGQGQAPLNCA
jgi:hypothetical protein